MLESLDRMQLGTGRWQLPRDPSAVRNPELRLTLTLSLALALALALTLTLTLTRYAARAAWARRSRLMWPFGG